MDVQVSSQLWNESLRVGIVGTPPRPPGSFPPILCASTFKCLHLTLCRGCLWVAGEAHEKNWGVLESLHSQGAVLCKLSSLASGEGNSHLSSPVEPATFCSYLPKTLPEVTPWLGFPRPPTDPPRNTSISGNPCFRVCIWVGLPDSANKDIIIIIK